MDFLQTWTRLISTFRVTDLIDILVIAVIIYYAVLLVRETRAEQLIKGFAAILIIAQVSDWLNLYTVHWLISNIMTVGLILVVVIFQPELRRAFERLGRSQGWMRFLRPTEEETKLNQVDEIVRAASSLARQRIGALMVIEGRTGLNDIIETGTEINGLVSAELLINIFIPNTPLHDGAVIIREDRILAAGSFLPLTENNSLSKELGTRHRAALGMSERSDAMIVIVSEETGIVSVAQDAQLSRRVDENTLREMLNEFFNSEKVNPIANLLVRREEVDESTEA